MAVRILIIVPILLGLTTSQSGATLFNMTMNSSGTVNGQPVIANAIGVGDSSTGMMTFDWTFTSIPIGYSIWATVVTKASSEGPIVALVGNGASNLFMISGGNYSVHNVATFPGGEQIVSDVTVSTSGTTVTGMTVLSGDVSLPPLVGIIDGGATWTPGPTSDQFIETVAQSLIRLDGGPPIEIENVATFTLASGSLPGPQFRHLELTVLNAVPDPANPTSATIKYTTRLTAIPEPSTLFLLSIGFLALLCCDRRRRKRLA